MIENGKSGPDIFTRIERQMDAALDVHTQAVEYLTDMGELAFAYAHDGMEKIEERLFGKLELNPPNTDYMSRSTLRSMQWEIVSLVGEYFMDHLQITSVTKLLNTPSGDPITSADYRLADQKLDIGLKRIINDKWRKIPELPQGAKQRWGYATAALAIFDEIQHKKQDMSSYQLEMRKMILEGSDKSAPESREFAHDIMKIANRDQLVSTLLRYISTE